MGEKCGYNVKSPFGLHRLVLDTTKQNYNHKIIGDIMADTNDIRFNKPADRLVDVIQKSCKELDGTDPEAKEILKIATDVIKRRLGL